MSQKKDEKVLWQDVVFVDSEISQDGFNLGDVEGIKVISC